MKLTLNTGQYKVIQSVLDKRHVSEQLFFF